VAFANKPFPSKFTDRSMFHQRFFVVENEVVHFDRGTATFSEISKWS
jgi:hypothetical protein